MNLKQLQKTSRILIAIAATITTVNIPLGSNISQTSLFPNSLLKNGFNNIAQAQTPTNQKQARPTRASTAEMRRLRSLFPQRTLVPNHTFRVNLIECGTCLFVPTITNSDRRLQTHLVQNNKVILTFPQSENLVPTGWRLSDVKAVSFLQLGFSGLNEDGIIIIANYITGIGRNGAKPFPVVMVYERNESGKGFKLLARESQVLTERQVSNITRAEKILRDEFQYLP